MVKLSRSVSWSSKSVGYVSDNLVISSDQNFYGMIYSGVSLLIVCSGIWAQE